MTLSQNVHMRVNCKCCTLASAPCVQGWSVGFVFVRQLCVSYMVAMVMCQLYGAHG